MLLFFSDVEKKNRKLTQKLQSCKIMRGGKNFKADFDMENKFMVSIFTWLVPQPSWAGGGEGMWLARQYVH